MALPPPLIVYCSATKTVLTVLIILICWFAVIPHHCSEACWSMGTEVQSPSKYSSLSLPLLLGWRRSALPRHYIAAPPTVSCKQLGIFLPSSLPSLLSAESSWYVPVREVEVTFSTWLHVEDAWYICVHCMYNYYNVHFINVRLGTHESQRVKGAFKCGLSLIPSLPVFNFQRSMEEVQQFCKFPNL